MFKFKHTIIVSELVIYFLAHTQDCPNGYGFNINIYICTSNSKSMRIMALLHEAKAERVHALNMLVTLSPNNQKRHLQYTKGGAVYAQWSEMMVYTLIMYNQFLCFSGAFTSVGICGAHCVRSEPWYWSLNLPGSSWIFLPKVTQTTTQPLDTSAPVAQHFWWAQVDSSAAGPWDQMNFDHGDDRFLVLNLHQMPALFHNWINYKNWLTSPLLRNPVLILWQLGPVCFNIEYSCAMLRTRKMDALWFVLHLSHFGRLRRHCLGEFPWSTRYTVERKPTWPTVIKKWDDVYHRSMSQKPSY